MQIFLLILLLICCTVRTSPVERSPVVPEVKTNNEGSQDSVRIVDKSSSSEDSLDRTWYDSNVMLDDSDWSESDSSDGNRFGVLLVTSNVKPDKAKKKNGEPQKENQQKSHDKKPVTEWKNVEDINHRGTEDTSSVKHEKKVKNDENNNKIDKEDKTNGKNERNGVNNAVSSKTLHQNGRNGEDNNKNLNEQISNEKHGKEEKNDKNNNQREKDRENEENSDGGGKDMESSGKPGKVEKNNEDNNNSGKTEDMDNNGKKGTGSVAPDNSDKKETSHGKPGKDETKPELPGVEHTTTGGVGIVVMDDKKDIGVQFIIVDSDFGDSDDSNWISNFSYSDSSDSSDQQGNTFNDKSSSNQIDWSDISSMDTDSK